MKARLGCVVVGFLSLALSMAAQVTGSGTPGHVPRWLSTTKVGNSTLFENSTGEVGIGTTAPAATLDPPVEDVPKKEVAKPSLISMEDYQALLQFRDHQCDRQVLARAHEANLAHEENEQLKVR